MKGVFALLYPFFELQNPAFEKGQRGTGSSGHCAGDARFAFLPAFEAWPPTPFPVGGYV